MAVAVAPDLVLPGPSRRPNAVVPRPSVVRPPPPTLRRPGPAIRRRPSAAVYRRRRLLALGLLAFVVVGVGALVRAGGRGTATGLPPTRSVVARVWIVHPGDTLWSIALASGARGDIRPLVDRLSDEVHGQPLQVGEQLTLP